MPGDVVELAAGDQVLADGACSRRARLAARRVDPHRRVRPHRQASPATRCCPAPFVRRGQRRCTRSRRVGADAYAAEADRRGARRPSACSRRCSCRSTGCCACCSWRWCRSPRRSSPRCCAARRRRSGRRAQTATAGLISIVPEGLVLLRLGHARGRRRAHRPAGRARAAAQRRRVARRRRHGLPRQDRHAHRRHARARRGAAAARRLAAEARRRLTWLVGASQTPVARPARRIAEALDVADVRRRAARCRSRRAGSGRASRLGRRAGARRARGARRRASCGDEVRGARPTARACWCSAAPTSLPEVPDGRRAAAPPGFVPLGIVVLRERLRAGRHRGGRSSCTTRASTSRSSRATRRRRSRRSRAPPGSRDTTHDRRAPDCRPTRQALRRSSPQRTAIFAPRQPRAEAGAGRGARPQRALRRDGRRRRQRRAGDEGRAHRDRARLRLADRQGRVRHRARERRLPARSRTASRRAGASSPTSAAWPSCSSSSRCSRRR